MRRLKILNITPSSTVGVPSSIQVSLDFTSLFHGKEWIDASDARFPFYTYDYDAGTATPPPPDGTVRLVATTFDIVENAKYAGRYTVYTKLNAGDVDGSSYDIGTNITTIHVSETLPSGAGTELTDGYVTHISTYMLSISGESDLVVLENSVHSDRTVEIVGRFSTGWGEVMQQNMLKIAQCSASPSPPDNPYQGQLWYDTINSVLKIKPSPMAINDWTEVSSGGSSSTSFKHTQSTSASTWTITHNLGLPAPYIVTCDLFALTNGSYKPILPADITYVDADTLSVSFSNPESGYALVRN